MQNSVRIICAVSVGYQINSLIALSRNKCWHDNDGSHIWEEEFKNLADARVFLRERAYQLASNTNKLHKMHKEISLHNQLTYNEVTVYIKSI